MKKGTVHLGSAHGMARPAWPSGPAPLGILARDRRNRGGGLLHGCRWRWLPILASRLWGGSGSGARAARRRGELNLGTTGRSGSPRRLLYGGGRSAREGSRCRKVVHGGAVLMVATGSSEGNQGRCYMVARRWRNKAAQWRRWVEEERLFTGGRAVRRRIQGRRNDDGKPWARRVSGGHGLRWSARSERRPVCEAVDRGPRSFVYFPICPKLAQLGN
jgi:hypothetical protein